MALLSYSGVGDTLATSLSTEGGIASDAAGNIYVADLNNNVVRRFPSGGGASTIVGSGFTRPDLVTVDALGNIYIADGSKNVVAWKVPAGGGAPVVVHSGTFATTGLAVDRAGDLYISERPASQLIEFPVSGASFLVGDFGIPEGLATDGAGNLYVVANREHSVYKLTAPISAASVPLLVNDNLSNPDGVAIDPSGNLFVSGFVNTTGGSITSVYMLPVGSSSSASPLTLGASAGFTVAADGAGNVYTIDGAGGPFSTSGSLVRIKPTGGYFINPMLPAGLSFDSSTGTISGTPTVASPATNYTVTAYNSSGSATATINIKVASNNANLASLALSSGTLTPAFASGTISYTASVPNATTAITVTPTTADAGATVKVNGTTVASGSASGSIPLAVGPNTITTVVTAQDGTTTKTYTVTVTRAPSSNDNLASLTISAGTLSPAFAAGTTNYNAPESGATASVTVTPTVADATASVTVNGTTVASGSASAGIPLAFGPNTIIVVVTAQDGTTQKTYTITAGRGSANASLANLTISSGTLSPAFAAGTTSYTASVSNGTASVTITPATSDATATLTINGTAATSGTGSSEPLTIGQNFFKILVSSQNGTTKTYSLVITRTPFNNANLSNLTISAGTLSPAFATGTQTYTASVGYATTSVLLTPTAADATVTIKVNGLKVASGAAAGPIPLATGINTINTVVTAESGLTKTYTVTITRTSPNANLLSLTASQGTISPVFAPLDSAYTDTVSYNISSVKVTPTAADHTATITVNGTTVASGAASQSISLVTGPNLIRTVVTAMDGTIKTYYLSVVRPISANANLNNLTLSSGVLSPAFATNTTAYSTPVGYATTSVRVTPTTADPGATVTVNGQPTASGTASASIFLNTGNNIINTVVTAPDGTMKTYTITVVRTSPDANLANLTISSGTLSPAFATATQNYTDAVSNAVTSVTLTPTTHDAAATVAVNGTAVASGTASPAITLTVGGNTVIVKVTAFDGTVKTYEVAVTRASSGGGNIVNRNLTLSDIENPADSLQNDGIVVHQGVSPNGDGINDFLKIDGITAYPDNHLTIINRNGTAIFEAKGYDNISKVFDGHSNITGAMQLPGTYFYSLDYKVGNATKHKTGFVVLKY